ncbi:YfiT family bacillithiol transferase [Cytobacillus purgationiresistens]|uniref:Putative metal-dependent hydrolase J2S17_003248 n=1 Tax=Cytobacillus purgationiresistens TaxID=863449 RepID=A0ABU0AJB6_9BACI|nr:putative metal-dependent hydrolase [Cytobacillus purgationiresistens]MDQ0271360.1 hypothetical protein [Cytobacillus purgationiresistens]
MIDVRYPIGKFDFEGKLTTGVIQDWIMEIANLPQMLRKAVEGLSNEQLDTPYREEGWTLRQVVHHIADSHMNAYIRCKLALTEDQPAIKGYEEGEWAKLPDYQLPVEVSLSLIETLHLRWIVVLKNLMTEELDKTFYHPDSGIISVGENIGRYAWHGCHHLAHITTLKGQKKW